MRLISLTQELVFRVSCFRVSYATRKQELQLPTEKGKRPVHLSTISQAHTTALPGQRSHLAEKTRGLITRGSRTAHRHGGRWGDLECQGRGPCPQLPAGGCLCCCLSHLPVLPPMPFTLGSRTHVLLTPAPHCCWSSPTGPEFKKQFRNITLHLYAVLKQSLKYVQKQYSVGNVKDVY